MWEGGFRVQDCAISPDGQRLVAADTGGAKIHVFDFQTYEEKYRLSLPSKPTSVVISRDSKHMLVNLTDGQIQLIDIETAALVQRFTGQEQGIYVMRSTFGGAAENFVVRGSEGEYSTYLRIGHRRTNNFQILESISGKRKMVTLWKLSKGISRVVSTQYHGTQRTHQCLLQQAMTVLSACKSPSYLLLGTSPNDLSAGLAKIRSQFNRRPKSTVRV